jgi:glycosyltransferase involved in cell wall biosynthesis
VKPVLFIAYHYPPIQAGAERAVRFAGGLPSFGYEPVALTTSAFGGGEGAVRAWEPLGLYRALFNRAGREAPHARTGGALAQGVGGRVRGWLVPDAQVGWMPHAIWRGLRSVRRRGGRLLFSTSPPASSHLVALALKRMTGLPWVADFRDCWTYDPLDEALARDGLRLQAERALEARVVGEADRVIAVTEVARQDFLVRYPEAARKVALIPNGFVPLPAPLPNGGVGEGERRGGEARRNGRLRLVYTGTFSRSHPGRSPEALFEALRGMPDAPELVLVGALTEAEREMARDLIERGVVRVVGPVSREEALAYQRSADLLVLVDHPRTVRASNVPSKLYEYAATGRPVLALVPDGAARDLILQLEAGRAVAPDAPEEVRRAVASFAAEKRRAGELRSGVTAAALAPFHWERLTERLAGIFDELT